MVDEREGEVMPAQWNTWKIFEDLAAEVAGMGLQYEAAERINLAATDRWRENQHGPRYLDPNEEIDDSSPLALTLTRLGRVVSGVTMMPESAMLEASWDPVRVRAQLLGY